MADDNSLSITLQARVSDFERDFKRASQTASDSLSTIENRSKQASDRFNDALGKTATTAQTTADSFRNANQASAQAALGIAGQIDRIIAKTNELNGRLGQLKGQWQGVMSSFQNGQNQSLAGLGGMLLQAGNLKAFIEELGGPLAAGAVGAGVAYEGISHYSALFDQAEKARTSAQAVEGFQRVMAGLGADTSTANGILSAFSDNLAKARSNGGALKTQLDSMGVSLTNADGSARDSIAIMSQFAARISATSDANEKLRLATIAVGDEFAGAFLQAINKSKTGLSDLASASTKAGYSFTNDLAAGAHKATSYLKYMGEQADDTYAQIKRLFGLANQAEKLKSEKALSFQEQIGMNLAGVGGLESADPREAQLGMPPGSLGQAQHDVKRTFAEQQFADSDAREKALRESAIQGPRLPPGGLPKKSDDDDDDKPLKHPSRGHSGSTPENDQDDALDSVLDRLKQELSLSLQIGDSSESIAERQRTISELMQAGVTASSAEGQEIASLVQKIDAAKEAQQSHLTAIKEINSAVGDVANGIAQWATSGRNFGQIMEGVLRQIETQMIKMALTGQNGQGGLLGLIMSPLTAGASKLFGFADGGKIVGPGSGRSDSMVARVSNGEFVVNAAATSRYLPLLNALNEGRMPKFADGGAVGVISAPVTTRAAQGGNTVHISPTVDATVHANGGSPAQNADLARQVGAQLEGVVRGVVAQEIFRQMRPGNMVWNAMNP